MTSRSRRGLWKNIWNQPPQWGPTPPPVNAPESKPTQSAWIVAARPAMGTGFELRLPAYTFDAVALAERCFDLIDELEMQMTIYRDDSALARLNASYHAAPQRVEPELYELLKLARSISHATDGAYDIATGALSRAWGFVKGPRRVPSDTELADALAKTGLRHVIFDDDQHTLKADVPGVELNLGSIGKGYAIDRVVRLIKNRPLTIQAMVHGGRSSLFAIGHQPGTLFDPWSIALHNPLDPSHPLVELKIMDQAVGTSGGTFQSFESGGRIYGHIIDPRTGIPPAGYLSVTVVAPTAAEADALSTAFFLTGPVEAARLIAARPHVGAIFLRESQSKDTEAESLVMNLPRDRVKVSGIATIFQGPGEIVPPDWSQSAEGAS